MSNYAAGDVSPQECNLFHRNSDCDSSPFAQHHTLGSKTNQAADGKIVADLIKLVESLEERITSLENP